jgi:hypothetical protein
MKCLWKLCPGSKGIAMGKGGGKMLRNSRLLVVMLAIALTAFTVSCGNPLEGGSSPSGSIIRVTGVTPVDSALTPDIFLTLCEANEETGELTFEPGLFNEYVTVNMLNESIPNTPEGSSTNSFVTMNRYRVDFAVLNMEGSIPSINGAGFSVGMQPEQAAGLQVLVLDLQTKEYIRSNFPDVGNTSTMLLRADITIWGEDAFQVSVKVQVSFTMSVTDYVDC